MISICIPVYNYDVKELVISLNKQLEELSVKGEIIILDDGSDEEYKRQNSKLNDLQFVRHIEQTNKGRAKTRNNLADFAIYQKLIFIDGDCLVRDNFISQYIRPETYKEHLVIGGLMYGDKPSDKQLLLRWVYGKKREEKISYNNNSISFLSSNFMIDTELFKSIRFDEEFNQYGHEDTMLGIQLRQKGINFVQIDNKVKHMGLEPAHIFLTKTKQATLNLKLLSNKISEFDTYNNYKTIKILNAKYPDFILILLNIIFLSLDKTLQFILTKFYPSMLIFDFYKLLYIFHIKATN